MSYTSTARVRTEAGFDGNPNVSDDMIDAYLVQSHGIVQSYVAAVYVLGNFSDSNPNFVGSQAEGVLKRAEELIAAGYVLLKEYGSEGLNTDKDGQKKIAEGEKLLQRLAQKDNPLRLVDSLGNEFSRVPKAVAGKIVAKGAEAGENTFSVKMKF